MTFQRVFGVMPPLFGLCLFFQRYFYCNLQTVRIQRELIKHTFLFCFLHCINIICVNIIKWDPNNLRLSIFFSLGICFKDFFPVWKMPYDYLLHYLPCGLSWYWVFLYVTSFVVYSCKVFVSGFIPLLEDL